MEVTLSVQHPDTTDFDEVSEEFSLINLKEMERMSIIGRSSLIKSMIHESSSFYKESEELRNIIDKTINILTESVENLNQFLNYIKYAEKWSVQQNYCMVFKKTHYLRMEQLFMVINILNSGNDQNFINELDQLYVSIKGFQILPKTLDQMNLQMIKHALQFQEQYIISFRDLSLDVNKLFLAGDHTKAVDEILGLKVIHSKIYTISEIFPSACLFSKTDIMNPSQVKNRWAVLKKSITHRCYGSPETVHNSFKKLKQQIIWANAAMNTMNQVNKLKLYKPDEMVQYLKKGLGLIGMFFFKQDAKKSTQRFQSQPDSDLTKKIFNMTDEGITKQMMKIILPKIQFSSKIRIPRVLNLVTLQELPKLLSKSNINLQNIQEKYLIQHLSNYRNKLKINNPANLVMRINCWNQVQYKLGKESTFMQKVNGFFKKEPAIYANIVLHIHGGGFISMSSYSHQVYTRKWANDIKVPFVSVDYAKAPEYPYPAALNDCLEAYLWILFSMPQVYEANPVRIFLVGDSAGGNLVASLTALLIRLGLKAPDGIFLIYPALNINSKQFTPSLLHSLQDFILPHTFLKICARSYIQNYQPLVSDFLLSPILIPSQILSKFPVTRIYVGSQDPFHDDCLRLTQKLLQHKVNAHITVYQNFGHGFLQFDNALQPIFEARNAVQEIGKHMKQIIYNGI